MNSQHLSLPGPPSASCNMVVPIFQDTRWLGGEHDGYARVPFEKYLELNRVRRGSENGPKIFRRLSSEPLAKLQCLMNFGLLEAVMEEKIHESKLIRVNSSGEQVLTSEHLPDLLLRYRNRIKKRQGDDRANIPDACRKWARRIQATFTHANDILSSELFSWKYFRIGRSSVFSIAGLEPLVLADILIQIGSILHAVGYLTRVFYPEVEPSMANGITNLLDKVPYHLRTTMYGRGWCPVIVDTISREFSTCMLGYARTLECPRSRLSERHGECTPVSCVVNTRDSSNDPPKHFPESCKCSNSMPSLEDVKRLLQERKIPVVDYGLSVKDSSDTPFVAISHVWGDGLRGTTEKGLPGCQIKRLAQLTSCILEAHGRASGGGAFWIDTLCIPEIDDMRHRAIGLMAQTYKEAEAVLVIDSGLRQISSSAPLEERMFHVVFSRWMQRLWTFQEGALAKKLYFEFSDALVPLGQFLKKVRSMAEKEIINPVLVELVSTVLRPLTGILGNSGFSFSDVLYTLRSRTMSKQSDETLAVCGVLNLDGFELARISDPDQRMETFLLRIGKLPASIIFLIGVSRLEKPGFRWAPKTFMRSRALEMLPERDALCTSTGLEAEYDAITHGVVVGGENSEWYISHSYTGRTSTYKVEEFELTSVSTPSCYTLLLDADFSGSGEFDVRHCAGVWVDPESVQGGSGGSDRILCEFRTVLILKGITGTKLSELEKSQTVMSVEYVRRMRVKVV
jgi:hypothetical protein